MRTDFELDAQEHTLCDRQPASSILWATLRTKRRNVFPFGAQSDLPSSALNRRG